MYHIILPCCSSYLCAAYYYYLLHWHKYSAPSIALMKVDLAPRTAGPSIPHFSLTFHSIHPDCSYHTRKPISSILLSSALKTNLSERTNNMIIGDPAASTKNSMLQLPIKRTATAYPFVLPLSCPCPPLNGTLQSSHYPIQRLKSQFIKRNRFSVPV